MKLSHSFVVCAYRESPYIEECIHSLLAQKDPDSRILIVTGTPSTYLTSIAEKYHMELIVNPNGSAGIGADWNFAISCVDSDLVTLAHQDDIYLPGYTTSIRNAASSCEHPLILFTDYGERRKHGGGWEDLYDNRLLQIKRILLTPLKFRRNWSSIFWHRRILSLGCSICCPSVTLCPKNLPIPVFHNDMKSNIDWGAWERISRLPGEFAYVPEPLMLHRIHEGSATSELLSHNGRKSEDLAMLEKFWPKTIAELIEWFYRKGEDSNQTQ